MTPIVNIDALQMTETRHGDRFANSAGRIGGLIGTRQLGAQYIVVPAGKAAFPRHNHHVNEEMFIILSGHGEWRAGKDRWPVRPGDVIAAPAGGADTAHQLTAGADGDLCYLAISTRHPADIIEYPDSGKFACAADIPPGKGALSAGFLRIAQDAPNLDYWQGED